MKIHAWDQMQGIDFLEKNKEDLGQSFFFDTDTDMDTFIEDMYTEVAKWTYKFAILIVCEDIPRKDIEILLKKSGERVDTIPRQFGTFLQLFPRPLFNIARDTYNATEAHKWEETDA